MAYKKIKNMNIRVLSAVIGIIGCCAVIFLAPPWASVLLVSVATVLSCYEFTFCTGLVKNKLKVSFSVIYSVIIPWLFYFKVDLTAFIFSTFIYITLLCFISLSEKGSDMNELFTCLFGGFFIPAVLSLLVMVLGMNNSKLLFVIPFVAAWVPDSFAHIIGSLFGKHKLIPHISPNKTVEGAVGGIVGGIIGMGVYGAVLMFLGYKINFVLFIVIGFFGAIFGLLGDLSFSYMKRKCCIKDYGRLIPGHGGVLDRFDSTIFVIPLCVFIISNTALII